MSSPLLSVIIPTRNRAALLTASLESLTHQTLGRDRFEVIVVDDGATDQTHQVCHATAKRLPLKYMKIEHSGISAAKNLGIFAARAPIILFFDDDDYAAPNLLEEHLAAHREHPEESVAILGYTAWAPTLHVTDVMHYIMDVGRLLFCYTMSDGQELDFTYFWGGRSSCKRAFLTRHGVFNQDFRFGYEDIELAYRLASVGLRVIFRRNAIQHMNRAVSFDAFCKRCEMQGCSRVRFWRLHSDPIVTKYCQLDNVAVRWDKARLTLQRDLDTIHRLENLIATHSMATAAARQRLGSLYRSAFDAFTLRGCAEALGLEVANQG